MALQNQVHIYNVDTSAFYNKKEERIHIRSIEYKKLRDKLKKVYEKADDEKKERLINLNIKINNRVKYLKQKLSNTLMQNKDVRTLNENYLKPCNVVSIFESSLSRALDIKTNTLSNDLIIVQTFFFDVLKDAILNGLFVNGEKYICFTASAGQIRTKKTVFIREESLKEIENSLMCGLTIDRINKYGGVNVNKFLAYLALSNSATDLWEDFDITKCIVVDDMETEVYGLVDFINDETYEITRQEMNVPIVHTDGCGMILPSENKKSFMVRLPWVKGLLVPFDYVKFIKTYNTKSKIKDIYGKEWDVIKDDIRVIFTKSQFKMWKYYKSWEEYCENFKKYSCQAGKCNEEEDEIKNAKINYQMLQTITDITDAELLELCKENMEDINKIVYDKKHMLKLLGVTKENKNKNYIQQALEIYPNLIDDDYLKNIINQTKKSLVKKARVAKIKLDCKYTFMCPDLYAFCEYLFLGNKNPKGLLKDGEVYCSLYKDKDKLDCLRSPHLYKEHAIRKNVKDKMDNNIDRSEWFITKGLYLSVHDLISKMLQNDFDGDKSLVCAEELFVEIAERNMKDIVPLFYNMKKAEPEIINNISIYNGLIAAYTGGNIGCYSNNISKIWDNEEIWSSDDKDKKEEALKAIKLLCMENNFTIDYAKTLYKPERPKEIKKLISKYTKRKLPHFFIYAKDKKRHQVESINNSTVNKLLKIIPNPRVSLNKLKLDDFDYNMLILDDYKNKDMEVIKAYKELDIKKYTMFNRNKNSENYNYVYKDIRDRILEVNGDIQHVIYSLVKYLYEVKKIKNKTTLWECFGDVLVKNLKYNISLSYMYCEKCGCLMKKTINNKKYCNTCQKEKQREWDRLYQAKKRKNRVAKSC